jgi:hypothetical protein
MNIDDFEITKFPHILEKNLPDKDTEFFWYCFKESILNIINKSSNTNKFDIILKDLEERSKLYNQMQQEKKFKEINVEIEKYIKSISRSLFIQNANDYDFNIYITNMKRWSKKVLNLPDKNRYSWLKSEDNDDYFIIFFMIRKYICEHSLNIKNDDESVFNLLMRHIIKYDPEPLHYNINRIYLDHMYKIILNNKYFKPSLLIEFSNYYPIVKDLQNLDIIKKDIPEHWTIDKIFKKGLLQIK